MTPTAETAQPFTREDGGIKLATTQTSMAAMLMVEITPPNMPLVSIGVPGMGTTMR